MPQVVSETQAKAAIANAPVVNQPTAVSASPMKPSPIPPQNVWAGGLGAVVTWFIVYALTNYLNFPVDPGLQTVISGFVGVVLAWVIPPSDNDVHKVLTDKIVQGAMADPESNVSYYQPPVAPPKGEAAVIVPPLKKDS